MRRALTPWWLASPSRFATISQPFARLMLVALAVTLVAAASVSASADQADTGFYAAIVNGVRHGGEYYTVAAETLRADGSPLRPFMAFPLPTLTVVEAAVPAFAIMMLLYALTIAVAVAWYARLQPALKTVGACSFLTVALFVSLAPMLRPASATLPETWAGLLVALSLVVRRPGRWIEAVAFGLAAATIRETVAPYLVVMAVCALLDGARREALGWGAALAVLAGIMTAHAHAVAGVVSALDTATIDWFAIPGFAAVGSAAASTTGLRFLPEWLGGPIVVLAVFGWASIRGPLASRVLAAILLTALLIGLFGQSYASNSAMLVTPFLLAGLAFAVDGLRDLVGAARDTRRITVTRIVR